MKQASWLDEICTLHYYRDKDQDEVDIVVESESGAIVGLEIKARATVNAGDFRGLRKLSEASGRNFKLGLVLYDSESIVPFGDRMFAAPISCMWG
jgi:predicted AAA+ superfamily ATPase